MCVCVCVCICFFQILCHCRLTQDTEHSFPCYTVHPCYLSIYFMFSSVYLLIPNSYFISLPSSPIYSSIFSCFLSFLPPSLLFFSLVFFSFLFFLIFLSFFVCVLHPQRCLDHIFFACDKHRTWHMKGTQMIFLNE